MRRLICVFVWRIWDVISRVGWYINFALSNNCLRGRKRFWSDGADTSTQVDRGVQYLYRHKRHIFTWWGLFTRIYLVFYAMHYLDCHKWICFWYNVRMGLAQASLRMRAVLPVTSLFTDTCIMYGKYLYKSARPLAPLLGWTWALKGSYYFSYFCSKHRLWVLVRTTLLRRFSRVPTIYVFEQKYENYQNFYLKTLSF